MGKDGILEYYGVNQIGLGHLWASTAGLGHGKALKLCQEGKDPLG